MKQKEFESQVHELRYQRAQELNPIMQMQLEVQQELTEKGSQINRLFAEIDKLKTKKTALGEHRLKIEAKWGGQIHDFIEKNAPLVENEWDNISTYTLVRHLRKRGWRGEIYNDDPEMTEEHRQGVIASFRGSDDVVGATVTEDAP